MISKSPDLSVLTSSDPGLGQLPASPGPSPSAIDALADQVLGWLRWSALAAGLLGLLTCAAMVVAGRRRRVGMAQDGLVGSLWVLTGLTLASVAALLVGALAGMAAR